jgi:hypothetical protein
MTPESRNYQGQGHPLTPSQIKHFLVSDEEIATVRDLMGDDSHRVTKQDVSRLRGLRGQNTWMGGYSLGMTADGFERRVYAGKLDRHSLEKPRRGGFKIPAPPAEVAS